MPKRTKIYKLSFAFIGNENVPDGLPLIESTWCTNKQSCFDQFLNNKKKLHDLAWELSCYAGRGNLLAVTDKKGYKPEFLAQVKKKRLSKTVDWSPAHALVEAVRHYLHSFAHTKKTNEVITSIGTAGDNTLFNIEDDSVSCALITEYLEQ